MKNIDNIEKLFKDSLGNFEADVNPQIWTNVQSGINSSVGSAASAAAKFAVGKIIAGVVSLAVIAGSIWYFASSGEKASPPSEKQQIAQQTVKQEAESVTPSVPAVEEQKALEKTSGTNSAWPTPPSVRTLNHYSNDNPVQQTKADDASGDNSVYSDVSALDNNVKPAAHKYGNATQGDGGMIRGTQNGPSNANPSSSDAQHEDSDVPAVTIFVNTSSGDAPLTVDFISQGIASSLAWDFGDGSASRENAPSHTFDKPGVYQVKLTAKNSSGTVSDNVSIEVKASSSVTNIPNIFTPNGDGENDYFFFEMKNIISIGVAIYSQAEGKQICTWNTLDGKWNGKQMNGQDAVDGVYLYSIQANGSDGVVHSKRGYLTLTRTK